jgi:type I restriction enzyme, S subunit
MKLVPLASIADIQLGKMLSPKARTGSHFSAYLRNQNVQWGRFELADLTYMAFSEREKAKFELREGDLLVCEGGEPGRCAVWKGEVADCYYQKAIHRVRPDPARADSEFLSLWIRHQAITGTFEDQNAKTTIAHLPLVRLQQLPVPALPVERQRAIAAQLRDELSLIDRARAAAQATLEELTCFGNAVIRESCDHPDAAAVKLGEVLEEVARGIGAEWSRYPVLGATRDGLAPAKEPVGKAPERYKLVSPRTVFYNPMRIMIGSIAMVDDGDAAGITSPDYVVLKGREGRVHSRWFYYWLRSPYGKRCIESLARGAVRERMLFSRLADGEMVLPPYSEQEAAGDVLGPIREIRAASTLRLKEIAMLPTRMLRLAFESS